jgi:phenylacetate-CoA ligase
MSDHMRAFYDALETRSPQEREGALMRALSRQVAHAKACTGAFGELLAGIDPAAITSRAALAALPVTRKRGEFIARQSAAKHNGDAFGGYAAVMSGAARAGGAARRVFQSPEGLYEPEGHGGDYERLARAMFAAGFRPGDLVHNSFSYHLTPVGAMMEAGAMALGCTVFPGGVGNAELQLQAVIDLRPTCYVGEPGFLRILVERAAEQGISHLPFKKALFCDEALLAVDRDWLQERGIAAFRCHVTVELGLIAYETEAREGLVVDEGVILEIVRPGSADPVPPGEVGELVVTSLNPDYPLIRFGSGDRSAILPGACPTGRTNARIKGWLGHIDQGPPRQAVT